ncbi:hypothetical protein FOCC_FOCC005018 [Frankliniella occidentalis]|nr:hypothetical protein FOCC_FOCC005018 [Frankliniella occidentalis]
MEGKMELHRKKINSLKESSRKLCRWRSALLFAAAAYQPLPTTDIPACTHAAHGTNFCHGNSPIPNRSEFLRRQDTSRNSNHSNKTRINKKNPAKQCVLKRLFQVKSKTLKKKKKGKPGKAAHSASRGRLAPTLQPPPTPPPTPPPWPASAPGPGAGSSTAPTLKEALEQAVGLQEARRMAAAAAALERRVSDTDDLSLVNVPLRMSVRSLKHVIQDLRYELLIGPVCRAVREVALGQAAAGSAAVQDAVPEYLQRLNGILLAQQAASAHCQPTQHTQPTQPTQPTRPTKPTLPVQPLMHVTPSLQSSSQPSSRPSSPRQRVARTPHRRSASRRRGSPDARSSKRRRRSWPSLKATLRPALDAPLHVDVIGELSIPAARDRLRPEPRSPWSEPIAPAGPAEATFCSAGSAFACCVPESSSKAPPDSYPPAFEGPSTSTSTTSGARFGVRSAFSRPSPAGDSDSDDSQGSGRSRLRTRYDEEIAVALSLGQDADDEAALLATVLEPGPRSPRTRPCSPRDTTPRAHRSLRDSPRRVDAGPQTLQEFLLDSGANDENEEPFSDGDSAAGPVASPAPAAAPVDPVRQAQIDADERLARALSAQWAAEEQRAQQAAAAARRHMRTAAGGVRPSHPCPGRPSWQSSSSPSIGARERLQAQSLRGLLFVAADTVGPDLDEDVVPLENEANEVAERRWLLDDFFEQRSELAVDPLAVPQHPDQTSPTYRWSPGSPPIIRPPEPSPNLHFVSPPPTRPPSPPLLVDTAPNGAGLLLPAALAPTATRPEPMPLVGDLVPLDLSPQRTPESFPGPPPAPDLVCCRYCLSRPTLLEDAVDGTTCRDSTACIAHRFRTQLQLQGAAGGERAFERATHEVGPDPDPETKPEPSSPLPEMSSGPQLAVAAAGDHLALAHPHPQHASAGSALAHAVASTPLH